MNSSQISMSSENSSGWTVLPGPLSRFGLEEEQVKRNLPLFHRIKWLSKDLCSSIASYLKGLELEAFAQGATAGQLDNKQKLYNCVCNHRILPLEELEILKSIPPSTRLRISVCNARGVDDRLIKIFSNFSNIIELHLVDTDATTRTLQTISLYGQRLRRLELSECWSIQNFENLSLGWVQKLEYLDLDGSSRVTDDALQSILQHGHLQELHLKDCLRVTDASMQFIVQHSNQLNIRKLSLNGCSNITLPAILEAVKSLKNSLEMLSIIECEKVTDIHLQSIALNAKNLQILELSDSNEITDIGLKAIAEGCKDLRYIFISSDAVTDDGLQTIATHCTRLEQLAFDATQVTDAGLTTVLKTVAPRLRVLIIYSQDQFNDLTFREICHCKKLENLTIQSSNLSLETVTLIKQSCTQLSNFEVNPLD